MMKTKDWVVGLILGLTAAMLIADQVSPAFHQWATTPIVITITRGK